MGITLKEEQRRLQPKKEINKELPRLKYLVLFSMGTRGCGRSSEFSVLLVRIVCASACCEWEV